MINEIKTIDDVKTFADQLVKEELNFHPDTDFKEYINIESGNETYSKQDAEIRNELMSQCFEVCEINDVDIYEIMQEPLFDQFSSSKTL